MGLLDAALGGLRRRVFGGLKGVSGVDQADLRFPVENQDDYAGRITFSAKREKYRSLGSAGIDFIQNTTEGAKTAIDAVGGGGGSPATSVKVTANESERSAAEQAAAVYAGGDVQGGEFGNTPTRLQSQSPSGSYASEIGGSFDPRAAGRGKGDIYLPGIGWGKSHNESPQNSAVVKASATKPKARQNGTATRTASASTEISSFQGKSPAIKTVSTPLPEYESMGSVQLYLPSTLQFADNIEYANVDLGVKGTAAANVLRNGGGIVDAGLEAAKKIIDFGGMMEAFQNGFSSSTAQVLALRLASVSTEVQGAVETETGIALNPNRRSTLRGVGVRRFRFTFKLQPTSPQEAREITKIINFFREQMYPEMTGAGGLVMNFPSKFDIKMHWGGKRVATQILPCFLENVDVVYNPNSMAFHEDGEFQQTDITLSFIEERALTKADIRGGY